MLVRTVELRSDREYLPSSDSSVTVYREGVAVYLGRRARKNPSGGGVFRYFFAGFAGGESSGVCAVYGVSLRVLFGSWRLPTDAGVG